MGQTRVTKEILIQWCRSILYSFSKHYTHFQLWMNEIIDVVTFVFAFYFYSHTSKMLANDRQNLWILVKIKKETFPIHPFSIHMHAWIKKNTKHSFHLFFVLINFESVIIKLIPRHNYKTRANLKRNMEGLELGHEKMKWDIDELKWVMGKMMKMLRALTTKEDPLQCTMIFEIISFVFIFLNLYSKRWPHHGL